MATLKNSKPKAGMKLHTFIATGGKPSDYNKVNKKSTAGSKNTKKK